MSKKYQLINREGRVNYYERGRNWFKRLIRGAAVKILYKMSDSEIDAVDKTFADLLDKNGQETVSHKKWKEMASMAMADYPEVLTAFLAGHKKENAEYFEEICEEMNTICQSGDNSTGSKDSSLASSKRALIVEAIEKITYRNFHLTPKQKEAFLDGYIYIHDMGHRRDTINCCLFDMANVLNNGFEMGEMRYNEPATLAQAFDVIASVSLNAAAQIYGGFTIPQIDEVLIKYARKSHDVYFERYTSYGIEPTIAEKMTEDAINADFENGFFVLEEKFNSIISPRGDYPFITISFGICKDKYAQMASKAALRVHMKGHGTEGHKRPTLFPKLVFLYDKNLHEKGKELYPLFKCALECSAKAMYPEYLSLTGESGIVSEVYKEYGQVISPMCCRAFLTKWFERGGETPADKDDRPVFLGRFNIGVVSINLPMILAKSRETKVDFYKELDYYLELSRQIHVATYKYLSGIKAHTNPLAFMQGGLYGGTLGRDDTIEPLLKSATVSFGITALNELQRLYNGKSLVEDGQFALDVMKYINDKAEEYKKADHIQYSVYGTPAESLCGRQVKLFKKKFGVIENVSDRDYFSNSFHCHVSEDITPIEKQDYESRFWDLSNGGKIQYIRFTAHNNPEALESIVKHAMDLGLYEGINISLAYCSKCGYEWHNDGKERPDICPKCNSSELVFIERMCGYIAFTRLYGESRLNEAKMAEIADRISM